MHEGSISCRVILELVLVDEMFACMSCQSCVIRGVSSHDTLFIRLLCDCDHLVAWISSFGKPLPGKPSSDAEIINVGNAVSAGGLPGRI